MDNKKKTIQLTISAEAYERLEKHPSFPKAVDSELRIPRFLEEQLNAWVASEGFRRHELEAKVVCQYVDLYRKDIQINKLTTEKDDVLLRLQVVQDELRQTKTEIKWYRRVLEQLEERENASQDESKTLTH